MTTALSEERLLLPAAPPQLKRSVAKRPNHLLGRAELMRSPRATGIRILWGATAVAMVACTTWQPIAHGVDRSRVTTLPYALRITSTDGSRRAVLAPFVRGDTLFGRVTRDTIGVPLADIQQLEQARFSAGRTAALLLAIPVAFIVAFVVYCGDSGCGAEPVS